MTPLAATPDTAAVPFARDLPAHGDRLAVVTADGELSYRDLAARVQATARRLGSERRLVLLAGANTLDSLVTYLAALAGGHPVILAPGDRPAGLDALVARYDPDVVARGARLDQRRAGTAHDPHPDLALLLSTSGSTGSPMLVRLSHDNLQANAEAIAGYLDIRADDRAATTLPMHYCYGLSVVNSHLLRGASLLLTDRSVADAEFWELFGRHRGTTLAAVPYTFDLLDQVGFADLRLPHLRYVTQAGGRLAPERVRRYAELGRRAGWDLFVMYGQTEATARMAYLPPDLAAEHPQCIGVPIPGGSFRLAPLPDQPEPDTGELVYTGPNVMLGYAQTPADLSLGRTVQELHTGDVARRTPTGLYEIIGRRSRFAKLFGLRIDLNRIEEALADHGLTACSAGRGDRLVVAVAGDGDPARVARLTARASGLPARAVLVCFVPQLPRLANGKPDYRAVAALADGARPTGGNGPDLRALFAEVLGEPDVHDHSTFVGLGGNSLSYVEMSIRLEQALGHLPANWHTTPIRDLRPAPRRRPGRRRTLDTSVALRAVAILLIVGTHAGLFDIPGGAHVLLGVVGFNVARFHLAHTGRWERVRAIGRTVGHIALASMTWIALAHAVLGQYTLAHVFLVNYLVGPRGHNDFWFIETVVYTLLVTLAAFTLPAVDRAERRLPFALPMTLMVLGLITRYQMLTEDRLPTPLTAYWLFAIGWAAAKATTQAHRWWVTAAVVATVPGFHGDLAREAVMVAGLLLLVWLPSLPSLSVVNRVASMLAGASLYIYLTHWQVYPRLAEHSPLVAASAALAVGVAYATLATRLAALLSPRRWRRATHRIRVRIRRRRGRRPVRHG